MHMTRIFNVVHILAAVALIAALSMPAIASDPGPRTYAQIPFAFEVGGVSMPAGKYLFASNPFSGTLIVTDPSGRNRAWLTLPLGNPGGYSEPRVVFERHGSSFRMSQVWLSTSGLGAGLPASKSSDRAARRGEPKSKPVTVTVALARN